MKYSKEKTQEICKRLELGMGRVDTCILSDISYETFTEWIKKSEFSEAIKKAEVKCKERNVSIIQKAAISTWQAAAWWLERKCHTEFALKTLLGGTVDGQPLTIKIMNYGNNSPA